MSDNKSASIARSVYKHAGRAKELLLQNLGRADKTTDEVFNFHANNFYRQQYAAMRFHKEFKNYISCTRAMQASSKSLIDSLSYIYESDWIGHEQLPIKAQALERLWEDLCHRLNDQIAIPLATYLNQFSEIRAKIAKRARKLVDYDKCRHNLQALQNVSKKRDQIKIGKAKEALDEAKRLYEVMNSELIDELPALYESRLPLTVSTLQVLFSAQTQFHNEKTKVLAQLSSLVDKLSLEDPKGTGYHKSPLSQASTLNRKSHDGRHYEEIDFKKNLARSNGVLPPKAGREFQEDDISLVVPRQLGSRTTTPHTNIRTPSPSRLMISGDQYEPVDRSGRPLMRSPSYLREEHKQLQQLEKKVDELYDIPVGATTTDLPPGVLYKVRATYKYVAEDVDELSFECGEVIRVIEYEDPEEQEEGWLLGVKESTGEKGLFPANFTRPI